jgi:thiol:disulfide interchange protein
MRVLIILYLIVASLSVTANDSTKLYNPGANVAADVQKALAKAKKEKKQVLLQIGGNWCIWCYRLNSFIQTDVVLKQLVNDNYIVYHLNYSKENKNLDYLKKLGFPQRFGFPVLVVLDGNTGAILHTQDNNQLVRGNGYDIDKVKSFLKNWAPGAFDEALYKE